MTDEVRALAPRRRRPAARRFGRVSDADERSFRLMVERMAEGAVTIEESRGKILYCNPAFAQMVGQPLEHVVGRAIQELVAPAGGARVAALWDSGDSHRGDYELVTRGGARVPVAISSVLVEGVRDQTRCLVVTDLTTRHDVRRLREAQRQLQLEARRKDDFIAMLGHELRNPLAPILHAAELLDSEGLHPDDIRRKRETIVRHVEHMRRIVDDLLDMARIARGRLKVELAPLDARTAVSAAAEGALEDFAPRGRTLEVELADQPLWVEGDRVRLTQVVANLLSNAAKFTEVGGRTVVAAHAEGGDVVVTVQDDGCGIDPGILESIFETFVQGAATLDRSAGGLGMGLPLVRRIVALHRGRVAASSPGSGEGARFEVRLPRMPAPPAVLPRRRPMGPGRGATAPLPIAAPRFSGSTARVRRVLVCDDNIDAAEMMSLLLRRRGFEVRTVHHGNAALQVAAAFRPAFVLLDIGLPDVDGYEVARRLRAQSNGDPVVIAAITGYGSKRDRQAALDAGCDYHLVKPVAADRLDEVLESGGPNDHPT